MLWWVFIVVGHCGTMREIEEEESKRDVSNATVRWQLWCGEFKRREAKQKEEIDPCAPKKND